MTLYKLHLCRFPSVFDHDIATVGSLYMDSFESCNNGLDFVFDSRQYLCDTLEPSMYDEIHPCIPEGEYSITLNVRSPRFKRNLPRLLNVPHRSGILIHAGNTVTDTSGCILVGKSKTPGTLFDSRNTLDMVISRMYTYNIRKICVSSSVE